MKALIAFELGLRITLMLLGVILTTAQITVLARTVLQSQTTEIEPTETKPTEGVLANGRY